MKFAFQTGDRPLPGYAVRRAIGRGGFGEVYYAVSDGGKEVALKHILQHHDVELRGVRQCMNLKCPNLVTIFDLREGEDGQVFVIMEYVAGPSLAQVILDHGGALPPEQVLPVFEQIATGLDYLHGQGIVHRDLKPSNVFLEDGVAKIGDYGLSKFIEVSDYDAHTMNVGSVHFMAPEVGSGKYGVGVDVYAMGAMLYQAVAGRVPFEGVTAAEILMKHLTAEPDMAPVPERYRAVLAQTLAKNPEDRPPSAGAVIGALDGAPAGPSASPGPRPDTPPVAADEAQRSEEPTLITPASGQRPAHRPHHGPRPEPELPEAGPGMSLGFRLWLAVLAAVAFELSMSTLFPNWARAHHRQIIGYIVAGAAGLTLASYSMRIAGIVEPLAHRIYSLALGLLLIYGYQRVWEGLVPTSMHENPWLVYFVIVLLLVNWHARSAPGRRKPVSARQCVRAGMAGGIAGWVSRVPFWEGFCVAGAMSFLVGLLTYGPLMRSAHGEPTAGSRWARRLFWCLGLVAAAGVAVAAVLWASQLTGPLADVIAPMAFCACVAALWYCLCKIVCTPSPDLWAGTARPVLLAAALLTAGLALTAGVSSGEAMRVLGFPAVVFCLWLALCVKALPPMACRPVRGLPGRYVVGWAFGLALFAAFSVVPTVAVAARLWPGTLWWKAIAFWLGAAGLAGLILFTHWPRVRIAGVLSSLTLALLVLLALAFGHHVYHDHVASLPWLQHWASAGLGGPSERVWPVATLSGAQVMAIAGQLVLAAVVLWWPAAHDPVAESPASGEVG